MQSGGLGVQLYSLLTLVLGVAECQECKERKSYKESYKNRYTELTVTLDEIYLIELKYRQQMVYL
jgi:hypothetical protein